MSKLVTLQNSVIVKDNIVVGKLPNVNQNDIILYNKKQTEKKLSNILKSDKSELQEIDKIVAQWAYGLGISIDAQDIILVNDFIRENFGNLNIFDLKACVKLITTNSDLIETDAEHYGKLSFIYVSKVLKAYLSFRNSSIFKVSDEIQKLESMQVKQISPEERLQNFKKLIRQAYVVVMIKKEVYFDSGDVLYNFIKHNKLMPISKPNIDENLINNALEYGNKAYEKAKSTSALQAVIKDVSFSKLKKEDIIKREARQYVVNEWLRTKDIKEVHDKLSVQMLEY
jgi:hypothetical protein